MAHPKEQALVRGILERAADHAWRIQDIGVLALRLDDRRTSRLHVWDPDGASGEPVVHDHPYDFTSSVIVGELVNTRYVADPGGREYLRERYVPGNEADRRADTVRLRGTSETLRAGDRYRQAAHELHTSGQVPGTVTLLHFDRFVDAGAELSVCRRPGTPWIAGASRPASDDEVERITTAALSWFQDRCSCNRPSQRSRLANLRCNPWIRDVNCGTLGDEMEGSV